MRTYQITVNTEQSEWDYTFDTQTADDAIAHAVIFHPDWTSMVVVFINTKDKS